MSSILSRSVLRQVLEKAVSYGADFAEVYAEHTKSNRMTMVDGEVLYRDGEFKTIDIEKVKAEVQRRTDSILSRL